jgi:serpin B
VGDEPAAEPTASPAITPPSPKDAALIAKSANAFGADLWGALRTTNKGNLAVSPASIITAFAMTLGGAKGDTSAEMKRALHLEGKTEELTAAAGQLVRAWNAGTGSTVLRAANRLFGEKTFAFEQPYLDATQSVFGAPLEAVDFAKGAEPARQRINGWVAQQTQDRIKDLIPPRGVDDQTRLALVNAMYFKGPWATPFEEARTQPAPFFTTKAASKQVPMMQRQGTYRIAAKDGVKALELPYKDGGASMVVVLPDAVDGLEALERTLTGASLDAWMGAMATERVAVSLPKFEVDPQGSLALTGALQALGMKLAFERGKADFTGIANPKSPADRLHISAVFHKAFVKVDEKGTEAAAATAIVTARAGAVAPSEPPKEFKADHPFLFFLRDARSGMILFMGRVADPSTK